MQAQGPQVWRERSQGEQNEGVRYDSSGGDYDNWQEHGWRAVDPCPVCLLDNIFQNKDRIHELPRCD